MTGRRNLRYLNLVFTFVISLSACTQSQSQKLSKSSVWRRAEVRCALESSSNVFLTLSEVHCVMMAEEKLPTGALVAQFDHLARTCSVFTFQSVCRSLTSGLSPSCSVFFRFPIDHRLISAKLSNLWLAGEVSRLENLVCQADEDTNRLHPVAVQWSSEGAVFDGLAAYAVLNKSSISFTTGLTWLLRLKRQPQVQPFFEMTSCESLGAPSGYGIHFWEYNFPRMLYSRVNRITGVMINFLATPHSTLAANPNEWLNIGFTISGSVYDFFASGSFLPRVGVTQNPDLLTCNVIDTTACMYLGMRIDSPRNFMFNGSIRALALANVSMTEAEIRDFFALIG